MVSDHRRALAQLRAQARQSRESGCFAVAARLEHQAAELARSLSLAGERTQALLWEGYSLRLAGEDDLALAIFLQIAGERAASADPSDVFSALTAIIHISLECKPAHFCRTLLEQGRRYLLDLRRPWTAPLDFLEGELAYRQGDFTAAWDEHRRAWAGWRDEYPRLTPATHLWALCRVAFRRRDLDELASLTEKLAGLRSVQALEQRLVQRAILLCQRAQRTTQASPAVFDLKMVETALNLLTVTGGASDRSHCSTHQEALRALALAGRWTEIDIALSSWPLPIDQFDAALCLGDLALQRMRVALGWPVADDDYGEEAAAVSTPQSTLAEALRETERYYQAALSLATAEDERLETVWYSAVVRDRQRRFRRVA